MAWTWASVGPLEYFLMKRGTVGVCWKCGGEGRFYVPGQRPGSWCDHLSKLSDRLNVASPQPNVRVANVVCVPSFTFSKYARIPRTPMLYKKRGGIQFFCQARVPQIGQLGNNGTYLPQYCATQHINPRQSQGLRDLWNFTKRREQPPHGHALSPRPLGNNWEIKKSDIAAHSTIKMRLRDPQDSTTPVERTIHKLTETSINSKKDTVRKAADFFALKSERFGHVFAASGVRQQYSPATPSVSFDWALINVHSSRLSKKWRGFLTLLTWITLDANQTN